MSTPNERFDKIHLANIDRATFSIERLFSAYIERIVKEVIRVRLYGSTFRVTDYPSLDTELSLMMDDFVKEVEAVILNGIDTAWGVSADKLGVTVSTKYGRVSQAVKAAVENPQAAALAQFKARTTAGMNLSDRVWKISKQVRAEFEKAIYVAIEKGTGANVLAREIRQYLKNPAGLNAAVAEAPGELQLSRPALDYKPGRGVYTSPVRNAQRLARNEINMAYRRADLARWTNAPYIIGFYTRLSNRHPIYDICDPMSGLLFPTSFNWSGWHVQCLCTAIPELAPQEEFEQYEDAIIAGEGDSFRFKGTVTEMPAGFTKYLKENIGTFQNWKRPPMFIADNPQVLQRVL